MTAPASFWRVLRTGLALVVLLAAIAHVTGHVPIGFITALDLAIADARLRAFMPRTLDPRIVIVDIDEKSLAEIGRWPWGRDRLADLVDELFVRQRVAVAGFDLVFAEPDASAGLATLDLLAARSPALAAALMPLRPGFDHDARFAAALAGRNVALGWYLTNLRNARRVGQPPAPVFESIPSLAVTRWDGYAASLPALARAAPAAGYFNNLPDPDGLVRRVPLVAAVDGRYQQALALAVYRLYTGEPAVVPQFAPPRWPAPADGSLNALRLQQLSTVVTVPVDAEGGATVPFRGAGGPHGGSFRYVSASDLLRHRLDAGALAGRLVLVGSTAPGLYDQRSTPVGDVYPGVEVHASLLSGLLDGHMPAPPETSIGIELLELLVIATLLGLALPRLSAVRGAALASASAAVLIAIDLLAYTRRDALLPLAAPLLLTGLYYFGATVAGYITEGRSRRALARLFGSYVPPELVDEMARDPARYDMRAENRELTLMFCDMRNFTRVAEALPPEGVRTLVNRFFSTMTEAIRAERGTLDKYIGDAIMAFWGAPLDDPAHAARAVRAALAMAERLGALNADLRAAGLPEIGIGIGLNTGIVCVGDMGSAVRRSYTVMGDAVNLASRIEGLTRHYGVDILVGESTRTSAEGDWHWLEVDRVRVKGKHVAVTLFTPVAALPGTSDAFGVESRLWRLALASYRSHHWDDTSTQLAALTCGFTDSPRLQLYRQLAARVDLHRIAPPAADWDGAHTFEQK